MKDETLATQMGRSFGKIVADACAKAMSEPYKPIPKHRHIYVKTKDWGHRTTKRPDETVDEMFARFERESIKPTCSKCGIIRRSKND